MLTAQSVALSALGYQVLRDNKITDYETETRGQKSGARCPGVTFLVSEKWRSARSHGHRFKTTGL